MTLWLILLFVHYFIVEITWSVFYKLKKSFNVKFDYANFNAVSNKLTLTILQYS